MIAVFCVVGLILWAVATPTPVYVYATATGKPKRVR